mmetsp:Transcript_30348/g.30832  ORF Transcript_30348/g.30832 Transcript_30348/m.30832 type:complete len:83 (+) Transcript_30348:1214-1462(+)
MSFYYFVDHVGVDNGFILRRKTPIVTYSCVCVSISSSSSLYLLLIAIFGRILKVSLNRFKFYLMIRLLKCGYIIRSHKILRW